MTAVEHRNRKEVNQSDTDREEADNEDELHDAHRGGIASRLGDRDDAAELFSAFLTDEELAEIAEGRLDDKPSASHGKLQRLGQRLLLIDKSVAVVLDAKLSDPDRAAEAIRLLFNLRDDSHIDQRTLALDHNRQRVAAACHHDLLHVLKGFDRRAIDRPDQVADLNTRLFCSASGHHAVNS